MALSNAVTQGKGDTLVRAGVSAIMEAIETWAAERIPPDRVFEATAGSLHQDVRELYEPMASSRAPADWPDQTLAWITGWDLLRERPVPVPLAMVDTVYTAPSPHLPVFPRTTTGLGAGSMLGEAVQHAALEVLERHAVAQARRAPGFFDNWRIATSSLPRGPAAAVADRVRSAGFAIGLWEASCGKGMPTVWCHVMEADDRPSLAPLPAEGFGCHPDAGTAVLKAIVEACQARLSAISGAREDLTRRIYPRVHDDAGLKDWREFLARDSEGRPLAGLAPTSAGTPFDVIRSAFREAGAHSAIIVPVHCDDAAGIYVARVVAPPLAT
jgi:ribosomal protein S12 methylthiotransferase accessory factor